MHVLPFSELKALFVMILAFYISLSRNQWPHGQWCASVAARLLEIAGSNPTGGMDVCLL